MAKNRILIISNLQKKKKNGLASNLACQFCGQVERMSRTYLLFVHMLEKYCFGLVNARPIYKLV